MPSWWRKHQWSLGAAAAATAGVGWLWYQSNRQRPGLQLLKRQGPEALPDSQGSSGSSSVYRIASGRGLNIKIPSIRAAPVLLPGNSARAQEANSAILALSKVGAEPPEEYAAAIEQGFLSVRYVGPFVVVPKWAKGWGGYRDTGTAWTPRGPGWWNAAPSVPRFATLQQAVSAAQELIALNRAAFSVAVEGNCGGQGAYLGPRFPWTPIPITRRCPPGVEPYTLHRGRKAPHQTDLYAGEQNGYCRVFANPVDLIGITGIAIYGTMQIEDQSGKIEQINSGENPIWQTSFTVPLPNAFKVTVDESTKKMRTDGSDMYDYKCFSECIEPAVCGTAMNFGNWALQDFSIWGDLGVSPFYKSNTQKVWRAETLARPGDPGHRPQEALYPQNNNRWVGGRMECTTCEPAIKIRPSWTR